MLIWWNLGATNTVRRIMEVSMVLPHYAEYCHIRAMHAPGLNVSQKQTNHLLCFFGS